jgi:hypothetical protein
LKKASDVEDALKAKVADTLQAMKQQAQDNHDLSEKLAESLANSERRNQQMTNEISKLSVAKKALELQVKSLNEQMKREVQIAHSQAALKAMSAETRFQEDLTAVKGQMTKDKMALITTILSEFDELEQFADEEIDDHEFIRVIETVAKTYRANRIHV